MEVDKHQSCGIMKCGKDIPSQTNVVDWRTDFKRDYKRKSVMSKRSPSRLAVPDI